MKKAIFFSILGLLIVAGILAGIKTLQIRAMIAQGNQFVMPPEVVTSAAVKSESWETLLTTVGSLDAVQGVVVTAEMTGKVVDISFESGSRVAAGDLLLQQDVSVEKSQLRAARAMADLAQINFERAKTLLPNRAISQSDYDNAQAQLTDAQAQIDNLQATMNKKTIRAPFPGQLGIRQINLGEIINDGQAIVTLQTLDPIFVNFSLPQQHLATLHSGLEVRVTADALPDQIISGKISAIDPMIDNDTRNIRVQAKLKNPGEKLRSGMYAEVAVVLPQPVEVLVIPITAVLYAPYSDSVFVIEEKKGDDGKPAGQIVRQQFISLGEKRGDFVTVTSGLKTGQTLVSTGVFKLRNGQTIVVDNKLAPEFKLAPQPAEG
ncbi:MAG: efflux RND transporter periplasmic adaptor subunit [Deltaproteobacteria bacterium]|jgi:membrane fusion protein (multidrug efflux system)|nr:efflux RND transporter periplasmic adaptor subunit [Deltaproteobacteria bacterium]MCW9049019.1 efflux RND transporter periplasmic adaptor subunit [Deltaproteobacteria bacterium]